MEFTIPRTAGARDLIAAARACNQNDKLRCFSEKHFSAVKIALVKLNKIDVELQLLDDGGYIVKQVRLRAKRSEPAAMDELNDAQMRAVRSLEKALWGCQEQGLVLVGFSDSLVALPEAMANDLDAMSSTCAVEVDTQGSYQGFEPDFD